MPTERIQKVLAAAGFGSRRACEALVNEGRVTVNGQTLRELPALVDPKVDQISVDRKPIRAERLAYYLLHKPRGVLCTHSDPAGRTRAIDLMTGVRQRLFPVGRLDADSAGLLIMTNDGELTQKLTHPRFGAPKTYRVEVVGSPSAASLEKLRRGVWLSEGRTSQAEIRIVHKDRSKAVLEITLREGRNREIRRMLLRQGHKVRRLVRTRIGKLTTRNLPSGAYRALTTAEVKYLYRLAERSLEERGGTTGKPPESRSNRAKRPPGTETARRTKSASRNKRAHQQDVPPAPPASGRKRRIIMP